MVAHDIMRKVPLQSSGFGGISGGGGLSGVLAVCGPDVVPCLVCGDWGELRNAAFIGTLVVSGTVVDSAGCG